MRIAGLDTCKKRDELTANDLQESFLKSGMQNDARLMCKLLPGFTRKLDMFTVHIRESLKLYMRRFNSAAENPIA